MLSCRYQVYNTEPTWPGFAEIRQLTIVYYLPDSLPMYFLVNQSLGLDRSYNKEH